MLAPRAIKKAGKLIKVAITRDRAVPITKKVRAPFGLIVPAGSGRPGLLMRSISIST